MEPSGAVGEVKEGESGSLRTRAVGGSVQFTRRKEGVWRRDLEGGGGGHRVMWGRVLWRDYKRSSIVNVTK